MNLITKYMTANRCYLAGRTITIKGIMIHSTATRGVMAKDWFSRWNNASTEVCVHAFVDDKEVYQYLPWNHRAWHCGGDGNNYLISIEMCEPKDINDKEYFKKVWTNTIELCVMLCKKYNLTEKDIMGHCEGYQKGIASNHSDPHHWFPLHGKNMNTFREELKKALNPVPVEQPKQNKKEEIDMGTIICYGNGVDQRVAELLADAMNAPTIYSDRPFDYSKYSKVICVGGHGKLPWTKYATKIITGKDRYETAQMVMEFIKNGCK